MEKITYRELIQRLNKLTDEQLDCDVTVDLGTSEECFAAEFRVCGENHWTLDDNHPVIYVEEV